MTPSASSVLASSALSACHILVSDHNHLKGCINFIPRNIVCMYIS